MPVVKIHYRAYAYPKPVQSVLTCCNRKVHWGQTTRFQGEVTCRLCRASLARRISRRRK